MTTERKAVGTGLSMHKHFSSEAADMDKKISITHVLADGRRVDSIDGFTVPNTGATAAVYHIAADFARKQQRTPREVEQWNNGTAKRTFA